MQTLKILTLKIFLMMSTYELPVIYYCLDIKAWNKVYDWIRTENLMLIHISCAHEVL